MLLQLLYLCKYILNMTTEVAPLQQQQQQHREDFTSEVFKIEITNCVYFGFGVITKKITFIY